MSTVKLEHVIARSMAELREEHGWTQSELAARMKTMGCNWTANRVTQVETLRGKVSLFEVVALTWIFQVPITRLLEGDDEVAFPNGEGKIPLGYVRGTLAGDERARDIAEFVNEQKHDRTEEIRKIARDMGISESFLNQIAIDLWGRSFIAERNRRAGDVRGMSKRSAQAKRGHASRALIAEAQEHLVSVGHQEVFFAAMRRVRNAYQSGRALAGLPLEMSEEEWEELAGEPANPPEAKEK